MKKEIKEHFKKIMKKWKNMSEEEKFKQMVREYKNSRLVYER